MEDMHYEKVAFRQRIKRIGDLSPLPSIMVQVEEAVSNPRSSAADVAQLISSDPALAAKLLKVANSAFYGFPRKIATITLAVVVLGFDAVKDLVMALSILRMFGECDAEQQYFRKRFWRHSICCGACARFLAQKLRRQLPGECFVAGLLHDIGKLVLNQYWPREFEQSLELAEREDITFQEAEQLVFAATHSEIGQWLAESWNLPLKLVEVIRYHHNPFNSQIDIQLVSMVHLANALSQKMEFTALGNPRELPLERGVLELFSVNGRRMSMDDFGDWQEEMRDSIRKAMVFSNLLETRKAAG